MFSTCGSFSTSAQRGGVVECHPSQLPEGLYFQLVGHYPHVQSEGGVVECYPSQLPFCTKRDCAETFVARRYCIRRCDAFSSFFLGVSIQNCMPSPSLGWVCGLEGSTTKIPPHLQRRWVCAWRFVVAGWTGTTALCRISPTFYSLLYHPRPLWERDADQL